MNITASKRSVYDLTINGKESRGWEEVDRWEGIVKLKQGNQTIIAMLPDDVGFKSIVAPILGDDDPLEVKILKASPGVYDDQ